jgi:hypothetical protein
MSTVETEFPVGNGGTVRHYRPDDPAVAVEFDSFLALLPQLRPLHGGHYVAVRGGRVIASGVCLDSVLKLAKAAVVSEPFYCGLVEPPEGLVIRFPSPLRVAEITPS